MAIHEQLNILDPSDACDLYCLHVVFMDVIQHALDEFRGMWNHHLIRGARTEHGHGGGVPVDLFRDPVSSESLRNRDDEIFHADPSEYGVDEPHRLDTTELDVDEAKLIDPLEHSAQLQEVRSAFFAAYPLHQLHSSIDDYIIVKLVSLELTRFSEHKASGGDWRSFADEVSPYSESRMWALRERLAAVALGRGF